MVLPIVWACGIDRVRPGRFDLIGGVMAGRGCGGVLAALKVSRQPQGRKLCNLPPVWR